MLFRSLNPSYPQKKKRRPTTTPPPPTSCAVHSPPPAGTPPPRRPPPPPSPPDAATPSRARRVALPHLPHLRPPRRSTLLPRHRSPRRPLRLPHRPTHLLIHLPPPTNPLRPSPLLLPRQIEVAASLLPLPTCTRLQRRPSFSPLAQGRIPPPRLNPIDARPLRSSCS